MGNGKINLGGLVMSVKDRIRTTELYLNGDKFYTAQVAGYIKCCPRNVNTALQEMMQADEIVVVTTSKRGTSYRRRMENPVIRNPWRKHSNAEMGITEQLFLGVRV